MDWLFPKDNKVRVQVSILSYFFFKSTSEMSNMWRDEETPKFVNNKVPSTWKETSG